MKASIKRYGVYGFASALLLFQVTFSIGERLSYEVQETIGYLTIAIALLFVFFAIRHYRDQENQGVLSLKNGLLIGLAITFFVALGSAIADYLYVTVWHPDFVTDYAQHQLEKMQSTLSAEAFDREYAEMQARVDALGSPWIMALVMFMTVMVMGTIISVLSSLFLQKKAEPLNPIRS